MSKSNANAKSTVRAAKAPASNAPVVQTPAPVPVFQLTTIDIARANVAAKAESGIGVTLHTSGRPIKGLAAEPVVAKPQRKMLRVIDKIIGHPGKGNCIKRFHLYREGMTLLHCKVAEGLIVSDVTFFAELGYLTLREATDAEYADAVKAWEAKAKTTEVSTQAA
jgi:hypothetical protein